MAPKARMRQANKLNEAKVTKRGKIPTTLVSTKLVLKYFGEKIPFFFRKAYFLDNVSF